MIISKTPLRISFVGGGTDISSYYKLQDGMVISSTIDKYIYVIIKQRYDNLIVLHYTKNEIVEDVNAIKHDLIREVMKKTGISNGVEITTLADISSKGSGLGSSSTVTVGLLNALYSYKGIQVTAETLAKEACEIEIDILKKPIGKQDQYAAAYGGINKIIFHKDESVAVKKVSLNFEQRIILGSNILLHSTNITRKADKILKEQKEINKIEVLEKIGDLTVPLENALLKFDYKVIGNLLKKNWEFKKQLASGITNPDIEKMIKKADNNGAKGYKIAGAGGGGFLISYVPHELQDNYRRAMKNYRELFFMFDPFGSRIIMNIRNYNTKI